MNNGRKLIRKRIVEILTDAAGTLGVNSANIYSNRTHEVIAGSKLPAIVVNTRPENVLDIPVDGSFREYDLEIALEIDCIVETTGPIGDVLDDFQDAVLSELLKHDLDQYNLTAPVWGDLRYRGADQKLDESGKKTIGIGSIRLAARYQAEAGTITPDDYEGSDIVYQAKAHLSGENSGVVTISDTYNDSPDDD